MSSTLETDTRSRRGLIARLRWPLMIGGPLIILAIVAWFVLNAGKRQSTDDAYLNIAKSPISAAVPGRVIEVDVKENQHVVKGQLLFKLDPSDQQAAAQRAEAGLAGARLQVTTLQHSVAQAQVNLSAALTTQAYTQREASRQVALEAAGVSSRQQVSEARHNADVATAQVAAAREQLATARADLGAGPVNAYPAVSQAQANLEVERIALARTQVVAPVDGVVTRVDQLQPGAYVNASQTVFYLLFGEPWVDANFKENQLKTMKVGQPATIQVDALGGQKFAGHVESFSPGAGQAFSPLPAENATGNWVKVVQRLPVRIAFDHPPPGIAARAGLSAKIVVDVTAAGRRSPGA
ncbi:MAG TPA: HlyD family secretion protein [Caulobacteraceae bacterium]|nr:HlyD family secretion protein [Caulobacteraceae bacterium]